jgi:hypothetical protein
MRFVLRLVLSCSAALALSFVLVPLSAFAQEAAAATAAAQPAWVTLLLQLGPFLIAGFVLFHPFLKLGALLHALALKHTGLAATVLEEAGVVADDVDAYVTKNQQSLKDMLDPTKRAAAEAALAADGIAEAKADAKSAVDAALARALPRG